jgi:OPA family glycerol-3-phosphate transporter-like MFS transporter
MNKQDLKQRWLNFYVLGIAYAVFYFSRYNLSTAHPLLKKLIGIPYNSYGAIVGTALLVYGLTVFLGGPLTDIVGGKKAILAGSAGALFSNLLFGSLYFLVEKNITSGSSATFKFGFNLINLVSIMTFVWSLNYFFQSFGALAIVKINSAWYSKKERGTFSGKFGSVIQLGRMLVLLICPWILYSLPWCYVFFIPALFQAIMFFLIWQLVEEHPSRHGHPSIKEAIKAIITAPKREMIVMCIFIALLTGMIRNGIEHQISIFFTKQFDIEATAIKSYLPYQIYAISTPFAMILSSLLSGPSSDKYFQSRRFPVMTGAFFLTFIGIFALMFDMKNAFISSALLVFIMFSIQGVNNILMGTLTADLGGEKVSGSVTGMFDGAQYIGGAFISYTLGIVLNKTNNWFYWPVILLVPSSLAIVGSTLLTKREKNSEHNLHA